MHVYIFRFIPEVDFTPRMHIYSVSIKEGENVLELLERIKHEQDGSLTFRGACGIGACGSCGMKVNGKMVLGCVEKVMEHMDKFHSLRISPLDESKVIKDLVINETPFFAQLEKAIPWLIPFPKNDASLHKMFPAKIEKLGNSHECVMCGICDANAHNENWDELGPSAFVKGYRYYADSRDSKPNERLRTLKSFLPIHYSLSKADLCPKNIFPGKKIAYLEKQRSFFSKMEKKREENRM